MANYNKLIDILSAVDKDALKQNGKGAIGQKEMQKLQL
jgi:hypothetical protein